MKKKFKLILVLGCLALACTGAACTNGNKLDEYEKKGYKVFVTYDANGGEFLKREGITIVDGFNPSHYEQDGNGQVHIPLVEPTDIARPTNSSDKVSLTKAEHFFAGWYQTRTVVTNDAGEVIDEQGVVLEETENGKYVYPELEGKPSATPAYEYSDYWDFEEDTVDYTVGADKIEITLYAAWVPYYRFDYYYKFDGDAAFKETPIANTTFDYKTTNAEGSKTADKDTIWLPDWKDGAMNYEYTYANNSAYTFPKVEDSTFKAAYLDEACTQPITESSFEHQGVLNPDDNGKLVITDRIQNIYIVVEKGEQYRIETAEQLSKNGNAKGIYEIKANLDFTGFTWPQALAVNVFTGKFFSTEGQNYTISNATVKYNSSQAVQGGLFGRIAKGAEIKNVTFENAMLDIEHATAAKMTEVTFGLFAGYIEEEATVTGVTVSGGIKVGEALFGSEYAFNLLTNSEEAVAGLTKGTITLQVYGRDLGSSMGLEKPYIFTIDPFTTTVDGNGNITLSMATGDTLMQSQDIFDIEIQ